MVTKILVKQIKLKEISHKVLVTKCQSHSCLVTTVTSVTTVNTVTTLTTVTTVTNVTTDTIVTTVTTVSQVSRKVGFNYLSML